MNKAAESPLLALIGNQLSAVTFVQDYVQLQFDGPGLTAITQPRVHLSNEVYSWGMPEYRNALCGQIGKIVSQARTIEGREIIIEFKDGSSISVSLKADDYRGPEAAILDNSPNPTCVW